MYIGIGLFGFGLALNHWELLESPLRRLFASGAVMIPLGGLVFARFLRDRNLRKMDDEIHGGRTPAVVAGLVPLVVSAAMLAAALSLLILTKPDQMDRQQVLGHVMTAASGSALVADSLPPGFGPQAFPGARQDGKP
jgi:MFS family permease